VVANVMRGGPSTGIPTKSEQSDLNIALYGFHGDAPHLVLGALSIGDCAFTTEWAVRLAEHLQSVAIVLSDQSLGQSRAVIDPPLALETRLKRVREMAPGDDYQRYRITEDGVSPMALPGVPEGMYTSDGLEHDQRGTPSSLAADHQAQLAKRQRKLESFDFGAAWGEVRGSGALCILTWGSVSGAVFEAADRLGAQGTEVRAIALRLLAPLPRQSLRQALEGAQRVWVVEQNQGAQLFHYLHAGRTLPADAQSFARPGPLPIRPWEILNALGLED
jgi:2-oxoglutarate ferredoxin oxidoreductase subunit alpha